MLLIPKVWASGGIYVAKRASVCGSQRAQAQGACHARSVLLGPVPALGPGETGSPAKEEGVEPGLR